MCEFHGSNGNGLGDIWWTDKCTYFSSIDVMTRHDSTGFMLMNVVRAIVILLLHFFPRISHSKLLLLLLLLLLLPWLVPSSGVAGIAADDRIPPCCPVC